MKKLTITLCTFIFLSSILWAESKPIDLVNKELDQKISWLISAHPDKKAVIEKLGAPQLDEKDEIYYSLNDYKYSLSLKFSNEKLISVNYKLPSTSKLTIKDFEKKLKAEDFSLYPVEGHEKGRYLSTLLKQEKLQLIFKNNSEKKLTRIIYDEK